MFNAIRYLLKRILAERKIIIISQNNVSSIPLGFRAQVLFYALLFCGGGWASYATGMYMANQHMLKNKEIQLVEATKKNDELGAQFSLLHRDMQRMMEAGGGKSKDEYENFINGLYAAADKVSQESPLMQRIDYLETRLHDLENYQQNFLEMVEDHTAVKIEKIKKVIDIAGISAEAMTKAPPYKPMRVKSDSAVYPHGKEDHNFDPDNSQPQPIYEDNDSQATPVYENQGGPFVGMNGTPPRYFEKDVMDGISELVNLHTLYEALPIGIPVANGKITSTFGSRRDPITRRSAVHLGTDFSAPAGAKISATAPGKVVFADRLGAYGNLVEIDHGYGMTTRYGHLQSISVKVGDVLKRGDNIGVQGNTGRSTGTHLHYEVRFNGRPINPQRFLNAGIYAEEKRITQK